MRKFTKYSFMRPKEFQKLCEEIKEKGQTPKTIRKLQQGIDSVSKKEKAHIKSGIKNWLGESILEKFTF